MSGETFLQVHHEITSASSDRILPTVSAQDRSRQLLPPIFGNITVNSTAVSNQTNCLPVINSQSCITSNTLNPVVINSINTVRNTIQNTHVNGSSWISAQSGGTNTILNHDNGKVYPSEIVNSNYDQSSNTNVLRSNNMPVLSFDNCSNIIRNVLPSIILPLQILNNLDSWDMDIFPLSNYELMALCTKIMDTYHFFDLYSIPMDNWYIFLLNVEYRMVSNNIPYHNFVHIVDIFQSCHVFLSKFDGKCLLQPVDIFAVLISALTHDLDHPGLNNTYQVNAVTSLAIRYNDVSILENYHCSQAFELLFHPSINLLEGFDADGMKYLRKAIIKAILSTDMIHHFAMKGEFEATLASKATILASLHSEGTSYVNGNMSPSHTATCAQSKKIPSIARKGSFTPAMSNDNVNTTTVNLPSSSGPNPKRIHLGHNSIIPSRSSFSAAGDTYLTEKERLLWISLIVHAADIGNPAKAWHLSKKWSDNVCAEFLSQGDREKLENLPVSMNCDRDSFSQDELSLNFIDFIVAPFFISFAKILPKFRVLCGHLYENRRRWHNEVMLRLSGVSGSEELLNKWELKVAQSNESLEPFVDIMEQ